MRRLRSITEENNEQIRHAQEIRAQSYATGQGVRSLIILTDEADALKAEYAKLQETSKKLRSGDRRAGPDVHDHRFHHTAGESPVREDRGAAPAGAGRWSRRSPQLAMANKNAEAAQVQIEGLQPRERHSCATPSKSWWPTRTS